MNTFLMILFITLSVGSATTFIYMRINHVGLQAFWTKLIASGLFVVGGFFALMMKETISDYMLYILLGMFFGMIGDTLNELKLVYRPHEKQYTNGGLVASGLSHIFYVIGISLYTVSSKEIIVPIFVSLALGSVVATILLVNVTNTGMEFGSYKPLAFAHTFVACISTVYAMALAVLVPVLWIFAVGMVLVLVGYILKMFIAWGSKSSNTMIIMNQTGCHIGQILIMILLFVL